MIELNRQFGIILNMSPESTYRATLKSLQLHKVAASTQKKKAPIWPAFALGGLGLAGAYGADKLFNNSGVMNSVKDWTSNLIHPKDPDYKGIAHGVLRDAMNEAKDKTLADNYAPSSTANNVITYAGLGATPLTFMKRFRGLMNPVSTGLFGYNTFARKDIADSMHNTLGTSNDEAVPGIIGGLATGLSSLGKKNPYGFAGTLLMNQSLGAQDRALTNFEQTSNNLGAMGDRLDYLTHAIKGGNPEYKPVLQELVNQMEKSKVFDAQPQGWWTKFMGLSPDTHSFRPMFSGLFKGENTQSINTDTYKRLLELAKQTAYAP